MLLASVGHFFVRARVCVGGVGGGRESFFGGGGEVLFLVCSSGMVEKRCIGVYRYIILCA